MSPRSRVAAVVAPSRRGDRAAVASTSGAIPPGTRAADDPRPGNADADLVVPRCNRSDASSRPTRDAADPMTSVPYPSVRGVALPRLGTRAAAATLARLSVVALGLVRDSRDTRALRPPSDHIPGRSRFAGSARGGGRRRALIAGHGTRADRARASRARRPCYDTSTDGRAPHASNSSVPWARELTAASALSAGSVRNVVPRVGSSRRTDSRRRSGSRAAGPCGAVTVMAPGPAAPSRLRRADAVDAVPRAARCRSCGTRRSWMPRRQLPGERPSVVDPFRTVAGNASRPAITPEPALASSRRRGVRSRTGGRPPVTVGRAPLIGGAIVYR